MIANLVQLWLKGRDFDLPVLLFLASLCCYSVPAIWSICESRTCELHHCLVLFRTLTTEYLRASTLYPPFTLYEHYELHCCLVLQPARNIQVCRHRCGRDPRSVGAFRPPCCLFFLARF